MVWKYLLAAYKGKMVWNKIRKQYGCGYEPSRYVFFPSAGPEYNAWGLYYLQYFIQKKHFDKVMLVTCEENLAAALDNIRHNNKHIISIMPEQMSNIMRYMALVNLGAECTIVSVKEPYDTGAERLLGKKGVTKEEIVWYDVFRMSDIFSEAPRFDVSEWKNAEKYVQIIEKTRKKNV